MEESGERERWPGAFEIPDYIIGIFVQGTPRLVESTTAAAPNMGGGAVTGETLTQRIYIRVLLFAILRGMS